MPRIITVVITATLTSILAGFASARTPPPWWENVPNAWIPIAHDQLRGKVYSNIAAFIPPDIYKTQSGCLEYDKRYRMQDYVKILFEQPGGLYKVGPNKYLRWGNQLNNAMCSVAIVSNVRGSIQALSVNTDGNGTNPANSTIYTKAGSGNEDIPLLTAWANVRQIWRLKYVPSGYRSEARYFVVRICQLENKKVNTPTNVSALRCVKRHQPITAPTTTPN